MATASTEKTTALATMDIKDLVAYYNSTEIVYNYFNNLAEAARGIGSVYSAAEAQDFINERTKYATLLITITLEMQKRINTL